MSATQEEMAEKDAWACLMQAHDDWKQRSAPSWGARAKALARNMMYPPSYINQVEGYIGLFLADDQMAERYGFKHQRKMLGDTLVR